ncbi:MAG TPA: hypothetical protein ENF23_01315 [Methanosarcinales archaeon]|nr:hypothetical protein [Methanosarcinales archaeon]
MKLRILFMPGFTSRNRDYKASDAVGYGITAAEAIVAELPRHGVEVHCIEPDVFRDYQDIERRRLAWISGGY